MTTKVTASVLANTAVAAGTYGGASQQAVVTVDAQGRLTYAANATPSIANSQITGVMTASQLAATAVTTGTYGGAGATPTLNHSIPVITVDQQGRLTSAANVTITNTAVYGNTNQITANTATGTVALGLASTAVTPATYGGASVIPVVTIDQQGRATFAANATPSIANSQITGVMTGSQLAATAVTPATYGGSTQHSVVTVDQQGRVTFAANATPSIANSQITGVMTASQLAATAVTTGTYGGAATAAVITVDQQGRITAAANAAISAGGQLQNVMALYPTTVINSTGTPLVNTGTGTFNFTCPTGVTKVRATVIAGGGGGGDDGCTGGQSGGYGGVGVGVYTVVPGTVYSVTVGNGGAGSSRPGNGSAGGSSSFSTFLTTTAGGGGSSAGSGQGSSGGATGATLKNTNSGSFSFTGSSFGTTVSGAGTKSWGISTSYAPGSGAGQFAGVGGVSGVVFLEYVG